VTNTRNHRPLWECPACKWQFPAPPGPPFWIPQHFVPDSRRTPNACWKQAERDALGKWWCIRSLTMMDKQEGLPT
jgi:hypothetical protein